jgi:hypothetical protein
MPEWFVYYLKFLASIVVALAVAGAGMALQVWLGTNLGFGVWLSVLLFVVAPIAFYKM